MSPPLSAWGTSTPRAVPPRVLRVVEARVQPSELPHDHARSVLFQVDIDDKGKVVAVHPLESSGNAVLDEAAERAVQEFEFQPARRGNQNVASRIRYRYHYPVSIESVSQPVRQPTSTTRPTAAPAQRTNGRDDENIVVVGRRSSREMMGRETTAEEILRAPGTRGDPLLSLQNLPGVARPPFGIGQFIVRSSAPEDSLITLEGQPIVLPFHFGGFASTIAADLIDHIEFLPGNFSARYGRVAGGVINISMRAPQRDRPHFVADLDLIDVGAYASVPLGKRASIGAGIRRSFVDLIGPLFFGGASGTSFRQWPFYWDYQLAFDWDPTPNDSIRAIVSGNDDQLILNFRDPNSNDPSFRGNLGTHLGFHGVQVRWRHRFSPDVTHTFAPAFGYNLTDGTLGPEVHFTFESAVISLRDELEARLSKHARFILGTDTQIGWLDNRVQAPPIPMAGLQDPINPATVVRYTDRRWYANPALYAELELDMTRAVRALVGVRVDHLGLVNATVVNPRAMLRIALHPRAVLRAGFGVYSSPPRGYFIVPGFGNPNLKPEHWLHATVGLNLQIIPGVLELDTDVFAKFGDDVVAPSPNLVPGPEGTLIPERYANTGVGRVLGAEWFLRLRPGRGVPVYLQLSYTHQRATRAPCRTCLWSTYQYDQPHIVSGIVGVVLPYDWEIGLRARYTSGLVEPVVNGALYDADHDVSLSLIDTQRTGRLPGFFSLDARIAKKFKLGPLRAQLILEVLNATNSSNPESRVYSFDRRTSQLVYGLPIIPSLGLRAEY